MTHISHTTYRHLTLSPMALRARSPRQRTRTGVAIAPRQRRRTPMAIERTLAMIKPDAVTKHAIGGIIKMMEDGGLNVVAMKMRRFTAKQAEGFYAVARAIAMAVASDFPNTSPRRIWAIARLAVQEAVRRRVLVAFAIFAIVLLFAGWFLDTKSDHPAHLYLTFVLTATERLILILAVLLTAFRLASDRVRHFLAAQILTVLLVEQNFPLMKL